MYECLWVCMYACKYVGPLRTCRYVCLHVCKYEYMIASMHVYTHWKINLIMNTIVVGLSNKMQSSDQRTRRYLYFIAYTFPLAVISGNMSKLYAFCLHQ